MRQGGQKCGESNNFWDFYEDDIARVVALNSTVFRLSLGASQPSTCMTFDRHDMCWQSRCLPACCPVWPAQHWASGAARTVWTALCEGQCVHACRVDAH